MDDLIQRANSMALEAHIMAHDAGATATELFTHLHMLRRHSVLDSPTVALPQRDKDRLLVMSVGGNDLFGPDARKVHEWKLDTEEENVQLIARVFDETVQRDKSKKKPSSSDPRPPRSVDQRSPLAGLTRPKPKDSYNQKPGQPFRRPPKQSPYKAHTGNQQRSQTSNRDRPAPSSSNRNDSRDQGQRRQGKESKGPQSARPFNRRGRGAEAVKAANRNKQLPVGGKLVHFKDTWTKLFPQHPEIVRKVSQGILIAFADVLPSLLRYPLELPSNNKAADLHAVQKLRLSQAIEEVMDRLEEVESVHCGSIIQNGNALLNNSSTSTTGMDHKDRLEGRIPSHPGTHQHPQILPVHCSQDSLSIPGPPVWTINSSTGIHQDSSPRDPAASFSRHPSPHLLGRLDNSCHFSRIESGTYTTHYTTSSITGMDNQLGQINVTTLQNPGLSGFTFQLITGPHIPSGLILTNCHRGPIPSVSIEGHVCSESFIHHQPDVTLCPIYIQRPSSSSVSPVLVQTTVDSTSAVVGHSNPVGCELPLLPELVSKSNSDDRGSVTSSGTQSVLLHGCISQRLGSQLDFRTMVTSRLPTSYQLVGTGGGPSCSTSLGSSVETSNCQSLLRQQYGSSIHPQRRGNTFPVPISKNSGTVQNSGSVCDNSHTHTPPRSQERHSRCSVLSQSTQSNRMAPSNRNLEQTVLCLRNSPDGYVCHSGEQGDARLCFSLPRRQSMGGRCPVPIMGRLGTSVCISSGSHCSQDSPENPKVPGHHGHHDRIPTSIPPVAPSSATAEHTSPDPSLRHPTVPVCPQHTATSIPPRSQAIGSSRMELIWDVLKRHHFPDTVVDMAADPLRDSSSNVYNSQWKAFALWANNKGILPNDLSFITLAEYLVYLFSQIRRWTLFFYTRPLSPVS